MSVTDLLAETEPDPEQPVVNDTTQGTRRSDDDDDEDNTVMSGFPTRGSEFGDDNTSLLLSEGGHQIAEQVAKNQRKTDSQRAAPSVAYKRGGMRAPRTYSRIEAMMLRVKHTNIVLYFYLRPVTSRLCHSLSCLGFQCLNAALTIVVWVFLVAAIPTCVALCILACLGLPLLWVVCEITILLARLEINMAYYMVEGDTEFLTVRSGDLVPSVWHLLPKCGSVCDKEAFIGRPKFVLTSRRMLSILLYDLFVKPITTLITGVILLLPGICIVYMSIPFMFAAHRHWFRKARFCLGSGTDETCDGWNINNIGDALALFFIGLVLFPLALTVNNGAAFVAKTVTYFSLTDTYEKSDRERLLSHQHSAPAPVAGKVRPLNIPKTDYDML